VTSLDRPLIRPGRDRAEGEIEVHDFSRRQTDTGVLMLLKTIKLMAKYAARRLRLQENWAGLPEPSLSRPFGGN
jgi:hypothetical protein